MKKLNIGAGSKQKQGYLHHDIRPLKDIDIVCDARSFPEELYETFDEVFASHVLEHFNRFEVKQVLQEWSRLLRHEGTIDIVVPDVREISRQLIKGYIDINFFSYLMFGGNDYEFNIHKFGFDINSLEELLESLGLKVIKRIDSIKFENRKSDKYCPMIRVIAKKI
jgi:ubiquinone/menaquinone biosynthesis C-methylase UbiE